MSIAEMLPNLGDSHAAVGGPPRRYQYALSTFEDLIEKGAFRDARVELLFGEIFTVPEMSPLHAALVAVVQQVMMRLFGPDFYLRTQLPFRVPPDSLPQPDVIVLRGTPIDHLLQHPTRAELAVEVCVSSEVNDRILKTALYAAASVPQYFILFPLQGTVEVYADLVTIPGDKPRYRTMRTYQIADRIPISNALFPDVAVAELLPNVTA